LPVLQSQFDGNSLLRNLTRGEFEPGTAANGEFGPGDLLLRTKYRFLHTRMADVAAALVLRFPTGNPHDWQGAGGFDVSPVGFASTPSVERAPGVRGAVHRNAGLDLVPSDGSSGEGRSGIGVDVTLVDRASLSVAFLGREPFSSLPSFAVPRADGSSTPL